jgi:hypothetical protein
MVRMTAIFVEMSWPHNRKIAVNLNAYRNKYCRNS